MTALKMDGVRGFRESRIRERAGGDRGHIGQAFRLPDTVEPQSGQKWKVT